MAIASFPICIQAYLTLGVLACGCTIAAGQSVQAPLNEALDVPNFTPPGAESPSEAAAEDDFAVPDVLQPVPFGRRAPNYEQSEPGRVPAQQAIDQGAPQQPSGNFEVRLAQTPNMLGDFFANTTSCLIVGRAMGEAVFQPLGPGTPGGADNLRMVTFDNMFGQWVFLGGPMNPDPGTTFGTALVAPLDNVVTDLSGNGMDPIYSFTAVNTGDVIDVFDNPGDTTPSLTDADLFNIFGVEKLILPAANPGDLVGRVRMQDNNSAMPQDRVYFDYNYFHNAQFTNTGYGVNRIAPGVEKTFCDGLGSVEVRVPMALTLNSDTVFGQGYDTSHTEFGNLAIAPKLLIWGNANHALSAGLGVALPTASDLEVFDSTGQLLRVRNEAVHLIPYLAYTGSPAYSDWFMHCFLTVDVDTGGNSVRANVSGTGLESIGTINDQTLLSTSLALGKFVYRGDYAGSRIRSLAWSTEVHYTTTLNDADVIQAGAFQLGTPGAQLDVVNGTLGGHVQFAKSILTLGYTVPLDASEKVFDGEFRLFINRPF